MTYEDESDRRTGQGIDEVNVLLARDPEHVGDAFSFEAFDDEVGNAGLETGHLAILPSVDFDSRVNSHTG